MRVLFVFLPLFISHLLVAQTTEPPARESTVQRQPPTHLGFLDLNLNGTLPLDYASTPNHAAFEMKYWFSQAPVLKSSFGLSWQIGFNEGYAESPTDFNINGKSGNELAYLYNYLSARYKLMTGTKKLRPYAEVGGGWLFQIHEFVDRPLNPDYDPDHSCPGENEYLRNTTTIQNQHHLALDAEVGFNYQLSNNISLNLGVGGIVGNQIAHLEEGFQPALLEQAQVTPAYQFTDKFLHSASVKLGVSIRLLDYPNEREVIVVVDD